MITPAVAATVPVDGFVRGTWTITGDGATAVLRIRPFGCLGAADGEALGARPSAARLRPPRPAGEVRVG